MLRWRRDFARIRARAWELPRRTPNCPAGWIWSIPNDKLMNWFFRNKGGGKFEEAGFEENVALREDGIYISGMGVDFRDLDNDGYPDIVIVALDGETFPLYKQHGERKLCRGDAGERDDEAEPADGGIFSDDR